MASPAACDPSQTRGNLPPETAQRVVFGPWAISERDAFRAWRRCSWVVVVGCAIVGCSFGLSVRRVQADEESAAWSMCYRDRTLATALAQAEDCLRAKATADGIVLLQWVLDQPFDGFVNDGAGRSAVSAKRKAERLLSGTLAAQYQRQWGYRRA